MVRPLHFAPPLLTFSQHTQVKSSHFLDAPSIIQPSGMLMITVLEARNLVGFGSNSASFVTVRVKVGKKDEMLTIRAEMNEGNPQFKVRLH